MKKLCSINCLLFLLAVSLFAVTFAVAQEGPAPGVEESRPQEEALPDGQASSHDFSRMSPVLWSYAVAATDGAVSCQELSTENGKRSCQLEAKVLASRRLLAEGRCGRFESGSIALKVCTAIKGRSCASWQEPIRSICEAVIKTGAMDQRTVMVKDVAEKVEMASQEETDQGVAWRAEVGGLKLSDLAILFAVIQGYREPVLTRRQETCEAYARAYYVGDGFDPEYFRCTILFSDDPVKKAKDIDRDLDVYRSVRSGAGREACDSIQTVVLREACVR